MRAKIDASLARLFADAQRFPLLSPAREYALAVAWHKADDRAALQQLVGSHLRLVVKIARGFGGYGLPLVDLVAEGNVGLMQAVEKFEPNRGFRFSSYAQWWVRAAILEYIVRSWSPVKMATTAAQKKLFFNLRRLKSKLDVLEKGDLPAETVTVIADELDVPENDVVEMNRRLSGHDQSLDTTLGAESDIEWISLLPDERPTQETVMGELQEDGRRHYLLGVALNELKPRERDIVEARHLKEDPTTLEELSHRYAVSPERIRQIEIHAVEKLQKTVAAIGNSRDRPTRPASRSGARTNFDGIDLHCRPRSPTTLEAYECRRYARPLAPAGDEIYTKV